MEFLLDLVFLFVIGFLLATLLARFVLLLFPRIGLMDRPHLYGLSRPAVPYPGGIVIVLSFLGLLPILFPLTPELTALLVGGILLTIVNFIDDRKRLPAWFRLLTHFLIGIIVVIGGIGITHISNPFGGVIPLDTLQIPFQFGSFSFTFNVFADIFTVCWMVLLMNSINWLDSIPGLTSGIGGIGAFTIFALSLLLVFSASTTFAEKESAYHVAQLALLFAGICFAFVRFDFFPARMIIGDTGTMFIGYILAILAIISGGKVATTFLVLGFPILDACWVTFRRILHGQSPFKGDLKHFPHRLLNVGFSERQTILLIYGLCLLFGVVALLLLQNGPHSKLLAIGAMALLMGIVATYIILLERKKSQSS